MINIIVDVLDLPKYVDRYLGITWGISLLILPFIFVVSLTTELQKAVEGQTPNYRNIVWNTVLVIFANLIYRVWFMKIVSICEGLAMSIVNYQDWIAFISILSIKQEEIGILNILNINLSTLLLTLTLTIAIIIEEIFSILRFLFLAVLYLVGPICVVSTVYQPLKILFKGWMSSVLQVSFWIIILRIFQGVILAFNIEQAIKDGNIVVTIVITMTLILACILAPTFTSKLFTGQNIGLLGSTVLAGMSIITSKVFSSKWIPSKEGKTNIAGAFSNVVSGTAKSVFSNTKKIFIREKTSNNEKTARTR